MKGYELIVILGTPTMGKYLSHQSAYFYFILASPKLRSSAVSEEIPEKINFLIIPFALQFCGSMVPAVFGIQ